MHCNTLKQDNDSTVRGDGGSRVGEVRAGTTSPMAEHKGFKLQQLSRDPLTPADGPGSVSVKNYMYNRLCRWTVFWNSQWQSAQLWNFVHIEDQS